MTHASPEYLLTLFRQGKDTYDIGKLMRMSEAQAARLIHYARDKERAARAEETKVLA